jgi:hypothetical protein
MSVAFHTQLSMASTFTREWFLVRWNQARSRAGKRFTEQLDVAIPLSRYFTAITFANELFEGFTKTAAALEEVWLKRPFQKSSTDEHLDAFLNLVPNVISGLRDLAALQSTAPTALPLLPLASLASEASKALTVPFDAALEKARNATSEEKSATEARVEWFSLAERQLAEAEELLSSPETASVNNPLILMLGSAGTGKTHLLCEMIKERIAVEAPALLFLGQAFQSPFDDVVTQLASSVGWTASPEQFFSGLDAIARQRNTRCLICIDAINEGHRDSWKNALPVLADIAKKYAGIAIVIGCRTPFENVLIPDPAAAGYFVVTHYGFPPEVQSDAVEKYFKSYGIPSPEVPFLEEEFANPLFLKLFCEALEKVTVKAKHEQIHDIAAGQRGMTHILEYFVDEKDRTIAKQLGTRIGLSWDFLKALAKLLATQHEQSIPRADATKIADDLQPATLQSGSFIQALINEDILAEDVIFDAQSHPVEVVRPTYQKFADHLIARYLLDSQLDCSSTAAIKRSLQDPARLGFFFKDDDSALKNITVVQALLIEFPTRVNNAGELFDYLDWQGFPFRLCEAFIEGLYWREPESINTRTNHWISCFLEEGNLREGTLNVLVALSAKPRHPLGIHRLDRFLVRMSIVNRDLFWTEYLRRWTTRGTPARILIWAEHSAEKPPSPEFTATYVSVLKWFLTSTQRVFRDRATHALFELGLQQPQILFNETLASLLINDIYVSERMLAASYGVAMSLWAAPEGTFQQTVLPEYVRQLFAVMFCADAPHGTTHVLARDYALGTVELALKIRPDLFTQSERQFVTKPFTVGGIRNWGSAADRDDGKYRMGDAPLGMDFENYTLGGLVRGRSPYDTKHPEYQTVHRQIMWRIYELGYSLDQFSPIDRDIARDSWRHDRGHKAGKTDRYGKKYSWIAFYELAGYRQDLNLLPRDEARISDADVDPSFPRNSLIPPYFTDSWLPSDGSVRDWIHSGSRPGVEKKLIALTINASQGPWVILHGFVDQSPQDKTIFTIFQSLFITPADVERAISILSALEYPGNRAVPHPESEHYTYAGEIPWRDTWRSQMYPASIGTEADSVSVSIPVREYSWESYHSTENQAGGTKFLSKEMAEHLNLYVQLPQTTMAVRNSISAGTIFVRSGEAYRNHESLLFIRQDLLDRYLADKGLVFLLLAWGERRGNYARDDARELEGHFEIEEAIHRQGFRYDHGRFDRFL